MKFKNLHAVGDSHSRLFETLTDKDRVHWLGPRTMYRVGRDGLDGLRTSKEYLNPRGDMATRFWVPTVPAGATVAWVFGEIDVRCHLVKAVEERGEDTLHQLVLSFLETVAYFSETTKTCPVIISVTPAENSANPQFPCVGSLEQRRALTTALNLLLKSYCPNFAQARFCDLWQEVSTPQGGIRSGMTTDGLHLGGDASRHLHRLLMNLGVSHAS